MSETHLLLKLLIITKREQRKQRLYLRIYIVIVTSRRQRCKESITLGQFVKCGLNTI